MSGEDPNIIPSAPPPTYEEALELIVQEEAAKAATNGPPTTQRSVSPPSTVDSSSHTNSTTHNSLPGAQYASTGNTAQSIGVPFPPPYLPVPPPQPLPLSTEVPHGYNWVSLPYNTFPNQPPNAPVLLGAQQVLPSARQSRPNAESPLVGPEDEKGKCGKRVCFCFIWILVLGAIFVSAYLLFKSFVIMD